MAGRIQSSQFTAWLLVAIVGPMLSMIGKTGWIGVLGSAAICVILSACIHWMRIEIPRWVRFVQLIWITVYLGSIAQESTSCWQIGTDTVVLPCILLILAALASASGAQRSARSSAVLVWLVIPLSGIVLLAGGMDLDESHIRMDVESLDWALMPLLLIPALGGFLSEGKVNCTVKVTMLCSIIAVILSMWMDASLTAEVVSKSENAFYQYSKGVTLFGIAERFEAVSACLLTAGWFGLFSIFLSAGHAIIESNQKGAGAVGVWLMVAIAVLVMCNLHIPRKTTGIISLICWGFLPILAQGIERMKMSKNSKKGS